MFIMRFRFVLHSAGRVSSVKLKENLLSQCMDSCLNVKGGKEFKKYFTLGIVGHFHWSKKRMETIQRHFSSAIIRGDSCPGVELPMSSLKQWPTKIPGKRGIILELEIPVFPYLRFFFLGFSPL